MNVYTDTHLTPEPWMQDAACASAGGDAWFPEQGDNETAKWAKRVCASCDVATQCLEFALRTKQREGIWAGYTARSLERLRRTPA